MKNPINRQRNIGRGRVREKEKHVERRHDTLHMALSWPHKLITRFNFGAVRAAPGRRLPGRIYEHSSAAAAASRTSER